MIKLQLQATPEEVMRAVEALEGFARDMNLSQQETFGLTLALEECGSNIVNHALRQDSNKAFHVRIARRGGSISIELRDHGPKFDPTKAPAKAETNADDAPPGGWGLQLVRRHMDEISYRRERGQNVLVLKKNLH